MTKKRNVYTIGGSRVRGVSSIKGVLDKPFLLPWAAKKATEYVAERWKPETPYPQEVIDAVLAEARTAHIRYRDAAGDFGTNMHDIAASYIGGQLLPQDIKDKDERRALENFIKLTQGWTWLGSEIVLINTELGYGGTADGLARMPSGLLVLPDIKTSNTVGADVNIQLALYGLSLPADQELHELWEEMREIGEGRVLHLNKQRQTWELLEYDLKIHYSYMPHFCAVHEWTQRFSQ